MIILRTLRSISLNICSMRETKQMMIIFGGIIQKMVNVIFVVMFFSLIIYRLCNIAYLSEINRSQIKASKKTFGLYACTFSWFDPLDWNPFIWKGRLQNGCSKILLGKVVGKWFGRYYKCVHNISFILYDDIIGFCTILLYCTNMYRIYGTVNVIKEDFSHKIWSLLVSR